MANTPSTNLQARTVNGLSELGEKIFLDRYAIKDTQRTTLEIGDTVIVCVNLKTGQREIGILQKFDRESRQCQVLLRDGSVEVRDLDMIDKPLETVPEQMFERIAKHIASVEATPEKQQEWQGNFREMMEDFKYVPAGRIFTGAGTGQNLTFYNCYVLPAPEDSRRGIFNTLADMADIHSVGGGVGIPISTLRPRYAYVKGVNGRSSGAVSWGSLYSFVTGLIEQGGSRRGALMLILNVWHPDVLDFIKSKTIAGQITNANISVGITDDFMAAVKEDKDWDLVFPDTQDPLYKDNWARLQGDMKEWKKIGGTVIKYKTVKAREIWDDIISSAWKSAEPGVYFVDRANYYSNSYYYAPLACTNPCGEQPIPPWAVCNLGHLNLAKHVNADSSDVDWHKLRATIQYAVRFQDNIIDATPYHFEDNRKQQMSERRVGMGTLGLAEMMIKLKVKYGSKDSTQFIDKLYQFIAVTAYETSVNLAKEKGAFPRFDAEKFLESGFMKNMPEYIRSQVRQHGIRNVTIITQAPTGTVGTMVGTSTGIEPFFAWTYFRKARLGVHEEKIQIVKEWQDAHPGEPLPEYFVNAMEMAPEEHVAVQAAVQRWTDSAISKTCNAPADYTVEQTKKLYEMMYDLGCKGGTIYRDSSRDEQILATDIKNLGRDVVEQMEAKAKKEEARVEAATAAIAAKAEMKAELTAEMAAQAKAESEHAPAKSKDGEVHGMEGFSESEKSMLQIDPNNPNKITVKQLVMNGTQFVIIPRERPSEMHGTTYKVNTPYGSLYITVNEDKYGPFEVFAQLGKAGGFFSAQSEAICRLISLGLRSGIAVQQVIEQMKGIRSTEVSFSNGQVIYSLPDAVGKVLEMHVNKSQQSLQLKFQEQGDKSAQQREQVLIQEEVKQSITETYSKTSEGASYASERKVSLADVGYAPVCPTCTNMLRFQEGCMKCESCGYSKCG